jgi:hypothetical protein
MRTHYDRTNEIRKVRQLEQRFEGGFRFGELGFMQPDVRQQLHDEAHASLYDDPVGNLDTLDLIDVFYLRHRLRRWSGTEQETDTSNRLLPLYTLSGLRAAFAVGSVARRSEWLPRLLMRRAEPELEHWEFVNGEWPEVTGPVERGVLPSEPLPPPPPEPPATNATKPPLTVNQLRHQQSLDEKRTFFEMVLDDADNPVYDVLDRGRVLDAKLGLDDLYLPVRQRFFGAVTAAAWLGRWDEPVDERDGRHAAGAAH